VLEEHERETIGVTAFADPDEVLRIPLLEIGVEQERRHLDRLTQTRADRDADAHARAMNRLRADAAEGANLMPAILAAVQAYATIGEMCNLLRRQYGEYREPLAV
jgi:methylmalonyl-CoA mutase N-terminal domain/subunit